MEYLEVTINTDPDNFEILQALLSDTEFDSFVDEDTFFLAYITKSNFENQEIQQKLVALQNDFDFKFSWNEVEEKNWNHEWEKNFNPVLIEGKCLIRADFHPPNNSIRDEVIIVPKMSFGTGHHATTYMMVNQMYELELVGKSVLDMGCGTAILAILAKKLGSAYTLAIDIDEWAVNNSIENCERNQHPEIEILQGGAEKLVEYQKFDVILANINRNILLMDMKSYASSLNTGGVILFSGFYQEDVNLINEEANKLGFELIDQNERENWSLLHYKLN